MKPRKKYRRRKMCGCKIIKAMKRADQKSPKYSYLMGKFRRKIKKRKPQIYRLKLIFKTTKMVVQSLNRKGMMLNREYAEI